MAELGPHAAAAHAEVGREAARVAQVLYAVGNLAGVTADAARAAGLAEVREFENPVAAATELKRILQPGDVVLLKASRAARFEQAGEVLRGVVSF
jgi:UDP-N-acetylmuramoyl-tripeptide--D-alanyl-D-alanine ligase